MHPQSFRTESGAGLLLILGSIGLVLTLATSVLSIGKYRNTRAELQLISDAASHAGALEFGQIDYVPPEEIGSYSPVALVQKARCAHSDCYENALTSTLKSLNILLPESITGGNALEIGTATSVDYGYLWQLNGGTVFIQRGRWIRGGFEPLDGSWQDESPVIPPGFLANAVRVEISRESLFRSMGIKDVDVQVSSIARAGSDAEVKTAPLAIPYCALVRGGDLMSDMRDLCKADILFTATRRFCRPGDQECGVLPSSLFDAERDFGAPFWVQESRSELWAWEHDPYGPLNKFQRGCFWPTPHFGYGSDTEGTYSDNFGVYAIKEPLGTSVEQMEIYEALLLGQDLSLGDSMYVSTTGLTDPEYRSPRFAYPVPQEERMYTNNEDYGFEMLAPLVGWYESPRPLPYGESVVVYDHGLAIPRLQFNLAYALIGDNYPLTDERQYICTDERNFPYGANPGVCNSYKHAFGRWDLWQEIDHYAALEVRLPPESNNFETIGLISQEMTVAVIADEGGQSCAGVGSSTGDPYYDGSGNYSIVGFVDLLVQDLDIGRDPPSLPELPIIVSPLENYLNSYSKIYTDNADESDPDYRFGFRPPWYDPDVDPPDYTRCNLIRARLSCNPQFIPSSNPSQRTKPVLVQ